MHVLRLNHVGFFWQTIKRRFASTQVPAVQSPPDDQRKMLLERKPSAPGATSQSSLPLSAPAGSWPRSPQDAPQDAAGARSPHELALQPASLPRSDDIVEKVDDEPQVDEMEQKRDTNTKDIQQRSPEASANEGEGAASQRQETVQDRRRRFEALLSAARS